VQFGISIPGKQTLGVFRCDIRVGRAVNEQDRRLGSFGCGRRICCPEVETR
jgi:hypothetical protein